LDQGAYCIGILHKSRHKLLIGISDPATIQKKRGGLAQIANDALLPCITGFKTNSHFEQTGDILIMRAMCNIPAHSEIFVANGNMYWRPRISWLGIDKARIRQLTFVQRIAEQVEENLGIFVVDVQNFIGTV